MRISRLEVSELFDVFNHRIELNLDRNVTIIIGPNGFGKTKMLEMITAVSRLHLSQLDRIPFRRFSIGFEDGSSLQIEKLIAEIPKKKRGKPTKLNIKHINQAGRVISKADVKSALAPKELGIIGEWLELYVDSLSRIGRNQWFDHRTEEYLPTEEAFQRYSNVAPYSILPESYLPSHPENIPDWLKSLAGSLNVRLINTERLVVTGQKPARRQTPSKQTQPRPSIIDYSERLVQIVKGKLTEYAQKSQALDRSFPARVLAQGNQHTTFDDLQSKLHKLEKKSEKLVSTGLLDKQAYEASVKPSEFNTLDPSTMRFLAVHAQDIDEKLRIFDDVEKKIDMLESILNRRFKYKTMSINKDDGFVFTTTKGRSIDPSNLSSGEQHEVVLLYNLLFETAANSLILIDEPELSLHVTWQRELIEDLIGIAQLVAVDLLLATHSPQIIGEYSDLAVELKEPDNDSISDPSRAR